MRCPGRTICLLLFAIIGWPATVLAQPAPPRVESNALGPRVAVDATPPKRDPETEKMVSTMIVYNNSLDAVLKQSESQEFVRFHLIVERPRSDDLPNTIQSHLLVALPSEADVLSELPQGMGVCELGGGMLLVGASMVVSPGAETKVEVKTLRKENRYFEEVCSAFSKPERRTSAYLDRLPHRRVFGVSLPIHVLFVQRESHASIMEDQVVRLYWPRAFSESQPVDVSALLVQRYGNSFLAVLLDAASTTGELSFSLPSESIPPTIEVPFPDVLPGPFRDSLHQMDAKWLAFLRTLKFNSQVSTPPNQDHSGVRRFMTRFDTSQFGSREFWDHISDGDSVFRKTNCLGVRFLVQENYARADELSNYRECIALTRSGPDLP